MNLKSEYHKFLSSSAVKKHPMLFYAVFSKLPSSKVVCFIYNNLCRIIPQNKKECKDTEKYFASQTDKIKENISFLADEKSKTVYKNILKYRCTNKNKYIRRVADKQKYQYIDNVVCCVENEVFIDVGAFFGESTMAFEKYVRSKNKGEITALLLEPDALNIEISKQNLKNTQGKFIFKRCAAGAESGTVSFQSGLLASSRISDEGSEVVEVLTVDELCNKNNLEPTYIKYDVEGADRDAVKGSDEMIRRYRPKLAVSIYHSDEDMVEFIQIVKSQYDFYDLYIRHYSGFFADTVLYCIPK